MAGPKVVDGAQIEGIFRAHQVPLSDPHTHPEHLQLLEDWLRSYRPEELLDRLGRLNRGLSELAPQGERRMGTNPHANAGIPLRDLCLPNFREYAAEVKTPGVRNINQDGRLAGNSPEFVHRQIAAQPRAARPNYCGGEFLRRQTADSAGRECVVSSRAKPMYPAAQNSAPIRRINSLVVNP